MKHVLVVLPVERRHREKLERAGSGCEFVYTDGSDPNEQQLASANIIIGNSTQPGLTLISSLASCRRGCI